MDDYESMDNFFRGFMREQKPGNTGGITNGVGSKKQLYANTRPLTNGLRAGDGAVEGVAAA